MADTKVAGIAARVQRTVRARVEATVSALPIAARGVSIELFVTIPIAVPIVRSWARYRSRTGKRQKNRRDKSKV